MDFNLKQWREQHQHESEDQEQTQAPPAKLPRLLFHSNPQPHSEALPLFVTEPASKLASNLSAYPTPAHSSPKYPYPRMGGSYFSLAQWQELELQALIFRHMLSGAAVPPELLHLVKKSLITNSAHPYYFSHPHLQPAALLQSGYWGRASMDPEPGRCRRTDGKKWRCSRDVVAGQKYCERHVHRGRNRSRKPVENTTNATPGGGCAASMCGGILQAGNSTAAAFNGLSPSIDHLQLNQRSSEAIVERQKDAAGEDRASGQILRHFFDDWPRRPVLLQQNENAGSNTNSMAMGSSTNLSISISGDHHRPTSDFSLKLSTGDGEIGGNNIGLERSHSSWAAAAQWVVGTNHHHQHHVSSLGGPLAEALRSSSTSNSSPTSVLHQLQRSEASYVSS